MSLEQALAENTAVMKQLIVVLSTAGSVAPAPAVEKATRAKKETPKVSVGLLEGDAEGTRYWIIDKHNTVAKTGPGEPGPNIEGTRECSGVEYLAAKDEFAKKALTPAVQPPAPAASAPSATPAPATASAGPTFEDVVNKMRELHKAQQNAGVLAVLQKYGVSGVPALNGKAPNADLIAAIEAQLMGL